MSVTKTEAWIAAHCDRIGTVDRAVMAAVRIAAKREAEARQMEASVASSAIFSACKPSFRSGGRRVGGGVRE